ncbi:MAG: ABC transporter ATP-binding protein [Kiritimatiellia bacterium]
MAKALLEVENLEIFFTRGGERTTPVRSVTFSMKENERAAIVGESGCGKSLTALSLTRLPPLDRATLRGHVRFRGKELRNRTDFEALRGSGIAYVFQDPSGSLNPVMRVQDQMAECLQGMAKQERKKKTIELLARTGLPDPPRAITAYPCELSGGQQQRVMLAMALASSPKLLIADEPTTALDVTTQKQVLDLIDELAAASEMAVLLITHNLGLVAGHTDRVNVMYAGTIVESGSVKDVLTHPRHPYTRGLLNAVPRLYAPENSELQDIPGTVPPPDNWPEGCAFAPRCNRALERCRKENPAAVVVNGHGFSCFNPV